MKRSSLSIRLLCAGSAIKNFFPISQNTPLDPNTCYVMVDPRTAGFSSQVLWNHRRYTIPA